MGMIKCNKHGNQVLSFVSPKIAACIRSNRAIDFEIEVISLDVGFGSESVHVVDNDFVKSILRQLNIVSFNERKLTEEEAFEVFCQLEGVCEVCAKDTQK